MRFSVGGVPKTRCGKGSWVTQRSVSNLVTVTVGIHDPNQNEYHTPKAWENLLLSGSHLLRCLILNRTMKNILLSFCGSLHRLLRALISLKNKRPLASPDISNW